MYILKCTSERHRSPRELQFTLEDFVMVWPTCHFEDLRSGHAVSTHLEVICFPLERMYSACAKAAHGPNRQASQVSAGGVCSRATPALQATLHVRLQLVAGMYSLAPHQVTSTVRPSVARSLSHPQRDQEQVRLRFQLRLRIAGQL